jgi:hypothetical protein
MSSLWCVRRGFFAAAVGLTAGLVPFEAAWAQVAPSTIADQDSIFIDGQSFKITPGTAKPDAAGRIKSLVARELGPGAIVYRSGDKLYIMGAPLVLERAAPRGPEIAAPSGPEILERGAPAASESPVVDDKKPQLNRVQIQYEPPKNPEHKILMRR